MKKIVISFLIIGVTVSLGIIGSKYFNKDEKLNSNETLISYYVETGEGTGVYEKQESTTWPEGYVLNEEKSSCDNGSTLSWDSETNSVVVTASKEDKCKVYMDVKNSDSSVLQAMIDETPENGTLVITYNMMLGQPVVINKDIIIDGSGFTITANKDVDAFAIYADNVTFKNLKIDVNGRGVAIAGNGNSLVVEESTIWSESRGINFYPTNNYNSSLRLNNVNILNSNVFDYENDVDISGDSRGVSLWNLNNSIININNSQIKGFTFGINNCGDLINDIRDSHNSFIHVGSSEIIGLIASNNWTSNSSYEFTNSILKSVNTTDENTMMGEYLNGPFSAGVIYDLEKEPNGNMYSFKGGIIDASMAGNDYVSGFVFYLGSFDSLEFLLYGRDNVKVLTSSDYYFANIHSASGVDNANEYFDIHATGKSNVEIVGYDGSSVVGYFSITNDIRSNVFVGGTSK